MSIVAQQKTSVGTTGKPRVKMDAATKPIKHRQLVRTASGDYVLSRTLADPDVKPAIDAYIEQVTRTTEAARQFLKDVGYLTSSGELAKRYGG